MRTLNQDALCPAVQHITRASIVNENMNNKKSEVQIFSTSQPKTDILKFPYDKMNHSTQTDVQPIQTNQDPYLTDQQIDDLFPSFSRQQPSFEIIASVAQRHSTDIHIILVKLREFSVPFLLDTGVSISLINRQHIEKIKYLLLVQYLLRKVNISTVNSVAHFSACAQFSFKIGPLFLMS